MATICQRRVTAAAYSQGTGSPEPQCPPLLFIASVTFELSSLKWSFRLQLGLSVHSPVTTAGKAPERSTRGPVAPLQPSQCTPVGSYKQDCHWAGTPRVVWFKGKKIKA